jgi:hypothetical protein
VGIDRPDDDDLSPAEHPDNPSDAADIPVHDSRQNFEPPDREEHYERLRAEGALDEQPPAGDQPEAEQAADPGPTAALEEGSSTEDRSEPGQWSNADDPAADDQHLPDAERPTKNDQQPSTPDLHAAATEDRSPPGEQSKPGEPTDNPQDAQAAKWAEHADVSRRIWGKYLEKWPPEERPPVDTSDDPPGSWRADSIRYLSPADNAEVDQQCDVIADREDKIISPRLREVESCDPDRHLIGFDHRLKGHDRIKEKVYDDMDLLSRTAHEAISLLPDAIRYTFEYDEARYTQGVRADILRMQEQGFKLEVLKNFWSDDQYKGINSQWIEPVTGQRFEMQFHTRISADAKEITHPAYERLRTHQADELEELVLEAFQRKVSADVPVPIGATNIPDYPEREEEHG